MKVLECLSWVSFLWDQVREETAQNASATIYLPYDIIVNIFTRIPAKFIVQWGHRCKSLCSFTSTTSFVEMHLRRTCPTICLQYYTFPTFRARKTILHMDISFADEKAEHIRVKRIKFDSFFAFRKRGSMPLLYGSYRGLLLFVNIYDDLVLYIWNPVTHSQAVVVSPSLSYKLRGFYFHPASGEYRVLYACIEGARFKFIVLGLKTKSSRKVFTSSCLPCGHRLPTILNGALHWMIEDRTMKKVLGKSPHCSDSIVIFRMDSEDFCTMPHPGGQCNLRTDHFIMMELMEFEGHLCLSDASSGTEIVIWILVDYEKQFWNRRHVVIIEPVRKFCTAPVGCNCDLDDYIQAVHIHGDEIFLHVFHSDLILYNLSSGAFRKVGNKCSSPDVLVNPILHKNSLVSVDMHGIVTFSS